MNRPYIVCYILSTLNRKITGPFMGTPAAQAVGEEYARIRGEYHTDAWIYETKTNKRIYGFSQAEEKRREKVCDD